MRFSRVGIGLAMVLSVGASVQAEDTPESSAGVGQKERRSAKSFFRSAGDFVNTTVMKSKGRSGALRLCKTWSS